MAEALAPFASWKGLVVVSGADIDAAMPAGDYSVRINDGLHPNKLGHKRIANAILKTLIKYRRIPKVGTRQPTL
jgi:lysophospholipase L1-like esterase